MSGTTVNIVNAKQVKAIEKALGIDIPAEYEARLIGGEIKTFDGQSADGFAYAVAALVTKKTPYEDGDKWEELMISDTGISDRFHMYCDASVCEGVINVEDRPNTAKNAKLFIKSLQSCKSGHPLTADQNMLRKALGLKQCK